MNSIIMKKLRLFISTIAIALGMNNMWAEISLKTKIFDANSQPPIVGGVIGDYDKSEITTKGIIVSSNKDDVELKENEVMFMASNYAQDKFYSHPNSLRPIDYRIVDCTLIGKEQFWCTLQLLKSDMDYYVRAFAITSSGNVVYGDIETIHTLIYSRSDARWDEANVWYSSKYALFDLATDEIINIKDGYYYSTNENPTKVYRTTYTNTCYKFATEWNYKLWYYHHTGHCDPNKIVSTPTMTYKNGKLSIEKNPQDADKNITIYYSINGNYFRPENYTDIYTGPIDITEPCAVYCYAISSDGYISYTDMYVVEERTLKGKGTTDSPYLIGTAEELKMFNEMLLENTAICGRLTADIVLNENVLDENYNLNGNGENFEQWYTHDITGYFNGAGHKISGLYINRDNEEYVALFKTSFRIDSLAVVDSYIKGRRHVGGISAWIREQYNNGGAMISNCYFDGVVIAAQDKAGGIAAHMGNTYGGNTTTPNKIVNCYNKGKISGQNHVGGICGSAYSLTNRDYDFIENCYNVGPVSASWTDCGSICGYINYVIGSKVSAKASKCYSLEGSCNKSGQGYDGEHKTLKEFKNGSVRSLLNANGGCFHQTIGVDEYPVIGEPAPYILTDGIVYNETEDSEKELLRYERTFNRTNWQALYVPFSMSYEDWKDEFEVCKINDVNMYDTDDDGEFDVTEIELLKIKHGSTEANTPYFIKAKTTGDKVISLENVTLYPAEENYVDCSSTEMLFTFQGTYSGVSGADMYANRYYALSGGSLCYAEDSSVPLKPMRWYMKSEARNYKHSTLMNNVRLRVVGEDATGINETRADKSTQKATYMLDGRAVNPSNLKKGIYIRNGKKIVL